MTNAQAYIKKCLELSERATSGKWIVGSVGISKDCDIYVESSQGKQFHGDVIATGHYENRHANVELIAFSREALPKVCEALKIALDHLACKGGNDCATTCGYTSRLCPACVGKMKIKKIFDDADGG